MSTVIEIHKLKIEPDHTHDDIRTMKRGQGYRSQLNVWDTHLYVAAMRHASDFCGVSLIYFACVAYTGCLKNVTAVWTKTAQLVKNFEGM